MKEKKLIPEHTVLAKNAYEGIEEVTNKEWDIIFFDHDLGTEEYTPYPREITGQDVAKSLVAFGFLHPDLICMVHSANRPGAEKIAAILKDAGVKVMITPISFLIGA